MIGYKTITYIVLYITYIVLYNTYIVLHRTIKKKQMNPHRLMNLYGDNLSCISNNELPNRVKKSIQLPITNPAPEPPTAITNQEE